MGRGMSIDVELEERVWELTQRRGTVFAYLTSGTLTGGASESRASVRALALVLPRLPPHLGRMPMPPSPVNTSLAPIDPARTVGYAPRLGTFSGTMLVVGGIIGAGIFLSPSVVAQRVGSSSLTLTAWALGAVVAIIGGFVYAELGARRPLAGGTYVYLRDAWGPLPAFLYGWALFLIMATGAIAAVAMTGASYFATLIGWDAATVRPLAIALIVMLTVLNILGVRIGATTGNVLTVLKLAAIGVLVLAALLLSPAHALPAVAASVAPIVPQGAMPVVLAMGAALVPVLFSYGGWQQTNAVAEELVEPTRTLFVSLGETGRTLITGGIVASTVGFLRMAILMSARVYQAMAADGLFFRSMATLHPRVRTPVAALVAQCIVALGLLLTGTYGQLLDYVVFADWIFFGLTAASLFVLRARDVRDGTRPRLLSPWHPVTTIVFIAAALYVVAGSVVSNPGNAASGAGLIGLGLPVYAFWRSRGPANRPRSADS